MPLKIMNVEMITVASSPKLGHEILNVENAVQETRMNQEVKGPLEDHKVRGSGKSPFSSDVTRCCRTFLIWANVKSLINTVTVVLSLKS